VVKLDGAAPPATLDVLICAAQASPDLRSGALLEHEWTAVQAAATEVFIPARAGRIVLLAPRGAPVEQAALENLARTLSVEWARYGITASAIAPGAESTDEQLATLLAYLVGPAGAYFSGCRFDMR
jgi:NAD(P)-dependent dehydrogenase (short-subunit alcohol dehydrogenase family)